jgi:hypothetical protein
MLNIYVPIIAHHTRREFFDILSSMLYSMQDQISFDSLIIAGDFNYSHLKPHILACATSSKQPCLLDLFFYNNKIMNDLSEIIIFMAINLDSSRAKHQYYHTSNEPIQTTSALSSTTKMITIDYRVV